MKGARSFVDPHLLITVRDRAGKLLEAVQESPCVACSPADADKLLLSFTWHLQTPLGCLPEGAAVFFELRHWKAAKQKVRAAEWVLTGPLDAALVCAGCIRAQRLAGWLAG